MSEEDLIDIAKSSDEVVDFGPSDQVTRFITDIGLERGDNKIRAGNIYNCYLDWCGKNKKKMNKNNFFKRFSKIFEDVKGFDKYVFYRLDGKTLGMDDEEIELARKGLVRPRGHKRRVKGYEKVKATWKAKKKKSGKVRKSEKETK